jgi:hypothetical protein
MSVYGAGDPGNQLQYIGMVTKPVEPYFIRQRMLGSEAAYRVVEEDDTLVTAEVVQAPGLVPGTRVRLLARAARAMERFDPAAEPAAAPEPVTVIPRLTTSGPRLA